MCYICVLHFCACDFCDLYLSYGFSARYTCYLCNLNTCFSVLNFVPLFESSYLVSGDFPFKSWQLLLVKTRLGRPCHLVTSDIVCSNYKFALISLLVPCKHIKDPRTYTQYQLLYFYKCLFNCSNVPGIYPCHPALCTSDCE